MFFTIDVDGSSLIAFIWVASQWIAVIVSRDGQFYYHNKGDPKYEWYALKSSTVRICTITKKKDLRRDITTTEGDV